MSLGYQKLGSQYIVKKQCCNQLISVQIHTITRITGGVSLFICVHMFNSTLLVQFPLRLFLLLLSDYCLFTLQLPIALFTRTIRSSIGK